MAPPPAPAYLDVALVFISHGEVVKLLNKAGKVDRAPEGLRGKPKDL